jgi:hypothetical protein
VTGSQNEAFYGLERRADAVKRADESIEAADEDDLNAVELARKRKKGRKGKKRKGKILVC